MAHPVAIVDFSYCLHLYRRAYKDIARFDSGGKAYPAGHIYGAIRVIQEMSFQYKAVILAIDSRAQCRYDILPTYKSGRHSPTGDPYEDYPIMSDLLNILKICTYRQNVFYIKHPGMESDDIIASWIEASNADDRKELYCYFNDVDILQNLGKFHWHRNFHEPEASRIEYIKRKFGLDLDYLPVWWKVVRGDRSDGIPSSIPRFPTKKLQSLCMEAVGDERDIPWFLSKVGETPFQEAIERNFDMVRPRIVPLSEFKLKRLGCTEGEVSELLRYYQINGYVPTA